MVTKICIGCKKEKSTDDFYKKNCSPDGVGSYCKPCDSIKRKKHYYEKPEKHKEYRKNYYLNNKEELKAYGFEYRKSHKEEIKIKKAIYYKNNKHIIKQYVSNNIERIRELKRINNKKNKHTINKYYLNRRKNDHIYAITHRIRNLIRMSLHRNGYSKKSKTQSILGCDFDFFMKHIGNQFKDGMTWNNRGEWHLDHIIPISSAKTEEEIIKLNHYGNFQPLWAKENILKSDTMPEQDVIDRITKLSEHN